MCEFPSVSLGEKPWYGWVTFHNQWRWLCMVCLRWLCDKCNIPWTSLKSILRHGWKGQSSYGWWHDLPWICSTSKTSSVKLVLLCVWLMNTPIARKEQHIPAAFFCGTSWKGPVEWLHLGFFLDIFDFMHGILEWGQFDWQEKSVRRQKDIFFQEWRKMDLRKAKVKPEELSCSPLCVNLFRCFVSLCEVHQLWNAWNAGIALTNTVKPA